MRMRYVGVGKNIPANQTNKHRRPQEVLAREVIRVSDVIIEVLDARFIDETRHKELEKEISSLTEQVIRLEEAIKLSQQKKENALLQEVSHV